MSFHIDTTAPRLPEDIERLAFCDVKEILEGAMDICSSVQDNDSDTWLLTRAGQFVRQTGEDADRFYVWPINEAFEYLDGMVEDDQWEKVKGFLQEAGIALSAPSDLSSPSA